MYSADMATHGHTCLPSLQLSPPGLIFKTEHCESGRAALQSVEAWGPLVTLQSATSFAPEVTNSTSTCYDFLSKELPDVTPGHPFGMVLSCAADQTVHVKQCIEACGHTPLDEKESSAARELRSRVGHLQVVDTIQHLLGEDHSALNPDSASLSCKRHCGPHEDSSTHCTAVADASASHSVHRSAPDFSASISLLEPGGSNEICAKRDDLSQTHDVIKTHVSSSTAQAIFGFLALDNNAASVSSKPELNSQPEIFSRKFAAA